MIAVVALLLASLLAANAAPAADPGLLYPVVPAAPHAYLVRSYAPAAPLVHASPLVAAAPVVHVPTSYSHVSHTQYTSHPVPAVYHSPLVYHEAAPAALVV